MNRLGENRNEIIFTRRAMKYECEDCGKSWEMWLQTGLEEHDENHKPVPFMIPCKYCGGYHARHIDWDKDIQLVEPIEITSDLDYFANKPNHDCGVPVFANRNKKDSVLKSEIE